MIEHCVVLDYWETVQVNMDDTDDFKEKNPATKTHAAVLTMIEDVRSYEVRFGPFDVTEEEPSREIPDIICPSQEREQPQESSVHERWNLTKLFHLGLESEESPDTLTPTAASPEIQQPGLLSKLKNFLPWRQHEEGMDEQSLQARRGEARTFFHRHDVPVNVFRLRFDEKGKLVMLGRRTPKPKPQWTINKATFLKLLRKKEQEASSPSSSEEKPASRFAEITHKISSLVSIKNLSKVKKIIPFIGKENEE